jgi:hypothetical protein
MRISVPQLEGEIIELLEGMKHGATLWFGSKLSGQYHLQLSDGQRQNSQKSGTDSMGTRLD